MRIDFVQPIQVLAADTDGTPSRTIQGIAVPYNVDANASTGPVRIMPGALPTDGPAPKLLMNHNADLPVGIVTERVDNGTEMLFSARVSQTAAGNEALVLAMDGVYDGVSVGVNATQFHYDGNTLVVEAGDWRELSLVAFPAFAGARITQVAAEASDEAETETPETETETSEEDPMPEIIEAAAPIQSAPIFVGGALTKPRITASEYISGLLTGNRSVLAAANETQDTPGLLPEPLQGDVWDTQFSRRPLIDAVGTRALPQYGETFFRRYISQHSAVAQQMSEVSPLASQPYQVQRQQFNKQTFGGFLEVSDQAGSWSEPALVQAILNDMVRQYSIATETYVVGQMTASATTATDLVASWVDGDDVISALYSGSAEMFGLTGAMPTHLVVHSDVWAQLGQAVTATGAYIFPYLNPSNSAGQFQSGAAVMNGNPLGLSLVVSNDAGSGNGYLLYGPSVEVYEDRRSGVRVENPSTASATLGLWGYIAAGVIGSTLPTTSNYVLALV